MTSRTCFEPSCGNPAVSCCSGCRLSWYCGADCQRRDWRRHRRECRHHAAAATQAAKGESAAAAAASAELLYRTAALALAKIIGKVDRGDVSWASLPAAEQKKMKEVVAMLKKGAAQGHLKAQKNLAGLYDLGHGVAQDYGRAFELVTQAAQQGDASSQANLGDMYRQGEGCEQSHERAVEWFAKAVKQGNANGQFSLGVAHRDGHGVPQSYERAVEFFRLSEAQGHALASNSLGMCYANAWGVEHSIAEERRRYKLAVARGETEIAPDNLQSTNLNIQDFFPFLDQRVVLIGLNTAALNGTRGTAVDFSYSEKHPEYSDARDFVSASGRYTVRLDEPKGRLVKVREANVTTTYNVRDYQNPDAGLDQPPTKATKDARGKTKADGSHRCSRCGKPGAKSSCTKCHRANYCGLSCMRSDLERHKLGCCAAVAAAARRATRARKATAARGDTIDKKTCVICIGPTVAPVELPCGHTYCGRCLAELRAKGVTQTCPQCRNELPPGVDGLYELCFRAIAPIEMMVNRGEASWESLTAAQQKELDEAIAMLTEAGAQGHAQASCDLGIVLVNVKKDVDGAEAAWRAALAVDPTHANARTNLGNMHLDREDFEGAEAAYRAAIAAEPEYACAHFHLGQLLMLQKDVDGAEAAYRAAIAADPEYTLAHQALGILLYTERKDVDGAEAAYRAAIAGENFRHLGAHMAYTCLGNLLRVERKDLDGAEAAYRAAIAWDPGCTEALINLGLVLDKREDYDGAEAVWRAAIVGDPGNAKIHHHNLGALLAERANKINDKIKAGAVNDDLSEALVALVDEVIVHFTIALGPEHDAVKGNKALVARLRTR